MDIWSSILSGVAKAAGEHLTKKALEEESLPAVKYYRGEAYPADETPVASQAKEFKYHYLKEPGRIRLCVLGEICHYDKSGSLCISRREYDIQPDGTKRLWTAGADIYPKGQWPDLNDLPLPQSWPPKEY